MLSVVIPARNEKYLEKTIRNVLANARGEIEIQVILDGYLPDPQIHIGDDRVIFHHFEQSIGQRAATNFGVEKARGEYVMKLDAHCAVAEGFDVQLAKDHQSDWTVVPRMYNLDIETFTPKLHKRTDYMYFSSLSAEQPFRAQYYKRQPTGPDIDDVMCCMGPGWFLTKARYLELGGMDTNHGGWGQMGIEVALKAWLSGGSFKVNKNTWFAHWFRGDVGFPYHLSGREVEKARDYSQDLWLNDKWPLAKRKLSWVIEKFKPPTWEHFMFDKKAYYNATIHQMRRRDLTGERKVHWLGVPVVKYPQDLTVYQEILFENKPDLLIETGTDWGGSALFFASIFDLLGKGEVISIDKFPREKLPQHPRITYLKGGSTSTEVLEEVSRRAKGLSVMVSLDSNHHRSHVKRELSRYAPMVTAGQYLVVEDTNYPEVGGKDGPNEAVDWFLPKHRDFEVVPLEDKWIYSCNPRGWLRRKR